MLQFTIDQEKCIQCNKCAKECPVLIINGKTEYPEIKEGKEKNCLRCQHCLAVCPTGALSILGKNPEDSLPVVENVLEKEKLSHLIQTRRSTRAFKAEALAPELIQDLVQTAAYAPTSKNENAVLLTLVDNPDQLAKLRDLVYSTIKEKAEKNEIPEKFAFMANFANVWYAKQIDVLFRGAPHLIIASAPKEATSPEINGCITLSYFELYANANGVGTLWNGFIKWALTYVAPELRKNIGIPEDHVLSEMMSFGYAKTKYKRSVQSEGLNLNTVKL